jgi:TolA-binding protein
MKRSILITLGTLLFWCTSASGQRTLFYDDPAYTFQLAQELFEKEKYGAARELFEQILEQVPDKQSLLRADAEYYAAVSAAELKHPDAQDRLNAFIDGYPGHGNIALAHFYSGRIYYERRSYKRAAESFSNVSPSQLSVAQRDEFYFMAGYSWFETGDYPKAKVAFGALKNRETRYKAYAVYYYAHVCYLDGEYQEALDHFHLIRDHADFRPLLPYYYAQILYKQKRYSEMATLITPLIDQKSTKRLGTIARLIGDAFYKLNLYDEALGYLEIYLKEVQGNIGGIDAYQIGYVYYRAGEYQQAIEMFQKATGTGDSLAQNAYYHLADCYIRSGEKRFAMNAFYEAYKLGVDPEVTEDALFNYAKLSYEMAYNPYNITIRAFEQFLGDYPASPRAAEAQMLLVNLYLSTRNYRSALTSIEKIRNNNDNLRAAYQRIAYYRGVELFNDNNFTEALEVLEKALEFNFDPKIRALTYYWRGETHYRMQEWEKARDDYNRFQVSPGAFDLPEFNLSHYNTGYTWFKEKAYDPALIAFRKFMLKPEKEREEIVQDATLRIADCYFMKKDYTNASAYYKQAGGSKARGGDYAQYQQALSMGAMGRLQGKADLLEEMISNYPHSDYRDDALFDLGTTYMNLDKQTKALNAYTRLLADFPGSSFEREALLKVGMIYFQSSREDLALKSLDRVVKEYRGTPESKEALLTIRDIYTATDRVEDYYAYVKGTQYVVTDSEKDSLAYIPAENHYLNGNCEAALNGFRNYIKEFPEGLFIINARFYKAECDMNLKNYPEALEGYNFVTSQHRTKFTEAALMRAAEIHLLNNNCPGALENYIRLEQNADNKLYLQRSRTGQMRCYSQTGEHPRAYQVATRIIRENEHPDEVITEAYLIRAKAAMALDSMLEAQTYFQQVLKRTKNEFAAEAKFNMAQIEFDMQNYEMAEKEIFELINDIPSYDYWIARAFILLSDVYVKNENNFQAKHTLQSIIDNYDGEELVLEARRKLKIIVDKEKEMEEQRAEEEILLKMEEKTAPGEGF